MNKWGIVVLAVVGAGIVTVAMLPRDAPTFVDAKGRTWRYAPKGEVVMVKIGTNIGNDAAWFLIYEDGAHQEFQTKEAMYALASANPNGPKGPMMSPASLGLPG